MIAVMSKTATQDEIDHVVEVLRLHNLKAQLSQGEEQVVVRVQKITDPPQEGTFAWPPPQLQVHSTGQVAEKLSAAAQPGQEVAIRGLLQDNHTLEVTDVSTSG